MALYSDLFNFDDSRQSHQAIFGEEPRHHSSWIHELIAGAAAMKAYEDYVHNTGTELSHSTMKEMLAGFAAAKIDKLFETKGLHFLDQEEAKRRAAHQAYQLADETYGSGGTFNW
ncbi:unnamed protein product [Rotaria sp. Silwood2]|nr:unnamed protein product [Rotaria sp. Silwood2]